MNLVLIGYRGSGKTTVGRLLAERLGYGFVDLDEQIVARAGQTIKAIFEQHGEPHFRDLETATLAEAATLQDHVLSLGGGAVLREENRRHLASSRHRVIYLRADPVELLRRIRADVATAANRPNLTPLAGGLEEITQLLAVREPIYRSMAHHEVDVTARPPAEVVDFLLSARRMGL